MSTQPTHPASTTPVADYLSRPCPGAAEDHLVVPRALAQSMPLRWQQSFVGLLAELHHAYAHLPWPQYKVVPSRHEALTDLDEQQLAAAGYSVDLDADGTLVYRDTAEAVVPNPGTVLVFAPVPDPLPRASAGHISPSPADPL